MIKKIIVGMLTGIILLSLIGCGTAKNEETSLIHGKTIIRQGEIYRTSAENDNVSQLIIAHTFNRVVVNDVAYMLLDNYAITAVRSNYITDLFMLLKSGRVDLLTVPKSAAEYMMKQDTSLAAVQGLLAVNYTMATNDENKALRNDINVAIKMLKDNGTLEKLQKEHIETTTPIQIELPYFEGAKTVSVGITGALPPLDYISEAGIPAGFNVALLSEIANILEINFNTVAVEAESRLLALTTNKIDVVFWNITQGDKEFAENEGIVFTDSYFLDANYWVYEKERDLSAFFKERFPDYTEEQLMPKSFQ